MFSHGGRKQICLLKPPIYPAAQEQYARSEFSRWSRKITLQNTRSTCGFFLFFPPAALNSFRDTKETAIETTTQFIGHSQLDSIDLYAAAGGIPMTWNIAAEKEHVTPFSSTVSLSQRISFWIPQSAA